MQSSAWVVCSLFNAIQHKGRVERNALMAERKEVLVVCGDNMSTGIRTWDVETGEELLRIPTCASPPHGLLCVRDSFLVASQLQTHRPYGGGAIFFWALNKPRTPHRSYPMEEIGPIACSKDGVYLVGGALSGNTYIWEVTSGRLLKYWHAHHGSLICLAFSPDDSLLISGSEDGVICVWHMISLLDIADLPACGNLAPLHILSEHVSSITSLLPMSSHSEPMLISSSLDGMCKVSNIVSGKTVCTHIFPVSITSIAVDPDEQTLLTGCEDGKIYMTAIIVGLEEDETVIPGDESGILSKHKGAITTLKFSLEGKLLFSASKDHLICIWDASNWQLIRSFNYGKGHLTNMVIVPKSSLSMFENKRNFPRLRISILDKAPQQNDAAEGTPTLLQVHCSQEDNLRFKSSPLLKKQILDLEQDRTPEAIQMKVETAIENRLWTIAMTKHVTSINRQLQLRLVDMMQQRLCQDAQKSRKKGRANIPDDRKDPSNP
ncbi:pre-rRNA-processing protein IPI3 protein [Dioscorea alata]|uniref:Pre-rRNA-processing protein IPI3 protein n=1 Tax=Dioscorea alata TaxID=55571 RepID=A0ACB7W0U4_DIOAL|nr:pre-rRNA-processing protein IPI3 protein [Dioscorea alata]